jgi:hypothetical protein
MGKEERSKKRQMVNGEKWCLDVEKRKRQKSA